jgi:ankyrin repeat protein
MHKRLKQQPPSLISAVQRCNLARVHRLIAAGADVNACDSEGHTVLMYAAAKGRTGIVRLLLKHGADSTIKASYPNVGWSSAISIAAYHGHLNVIRLFLHRNGKRASAEWNWSEKRTVFLPNHRGKKKGLGHRIGWYTQRHGSEIPFLRFVALLHAAKGNKAAAVALLRPYGDYGFHKTRIGSNWFVQAVEYDHRDDAKMYLDLGVEIDTPTTWGQCETALIMAAGNGSIPMAELLLSRGADVNASTDYGYTPLMGAAHHGQTEMVRWLLSLGADVYAKTDYGFDVFNWLNPPDESLSYRLPPSIYERLLSLLPAKQEIRLLLEQHIKTLAKKDIEAV